MSIEKELRQNWDSVVYPEPDVDQQAMPPGYQEGDVLLAQARHPRTGRPMTGPTMSDVTEPAMGLLNMGASALKGVTQGFLGLPGELEALVYGAKELLTRRADEGAFDAFINGLKKETILPTTEEVKKWLDTNVGEVPGVKTFETLGETIAPGGQYKAVKAGAKALKNMPVGMSTEAVGGMQKVLTPPNATAPTSDIGFFSAVEQAALNIKRNSGTGQAMLNDITKGENVKSDEIKWIGLDEFLAGKKNVTKQEVQDFIAANKVDVQEVQLSDASKAENDMKLRSKLSAMSDDELADATQRFDFNNPNFRQEAIDDFMAERASYFDGHPEDDFPNVPKFGSYQLPGGQNYREILLTMPAKERMVETAIPSAKKKPTVFETSNGQFELLDEMGEPFAKYNTKDEAEKAATDWAAPFTKKEIVKDKEYLSPHWEQPNVLAHIRVNDRVDADGKKMLLVEEVQSDWHQAGRDKGYQTKIDLSSKIKELSDEDKTKFGVSSGVLMENNGTWGWMPSRQEAESFLMQRQNVSGVPDAPMKDTWYQLALKRVLKYAADNGYERVGLTTGNRQAERYDLSKQVNAVSYHPDDNGRGMFLNVFGKNNEIVYSKLTPEDKVADVIGKETAKKLLAQKPVDDSQVLEGLDLKVGGEGMKKYYDDIYPNYLQKYGKKWGAKVGETSIQADGKEPVRYIDITPEMRKSVGKGQPLFTATGLATGTGAGTMATSQQEPK